MRKSIIFITLLIPILIAIVLKFFGRNQYDIPIYYEDGIQKQDCGLDQKGQYYVSELEFEQRDFTWTGKMNLVYFNSNQDPELSYIQQELLKLASEKPPDLNLKIWSLGALDKPDANRTDIIYLPLSTDQLQDISRCQFLIPDNLEQGWSEFGVIVLIDQESRIRGYYNGGEQEEYDRLSAEIDILDLENDNKK